MFVNLAIGWWAHRKSKADSFDDYATASRSLPTGGADYDDIGDVDFFYGNVDNG